MTATRLKQIVLAALLGFLAVFTAFVAATH